MIYTDECIMENIIQMESIPDFNITPEQINRLIESVSIIYTKDFEELFLNEAKREYRNLTDLMRETINDSTDIINRTKICAKEIVEYIKVNGLNKSAFGKVTAIVGKYFGDVSKIISVDNKILNDKRFSNYDSDKLRNAANIFLHMIIWITICQIVISIFTFSIPIVNNVLTCCIIAPIFEEYAKKLSTRSGCIKEFYIIFNTFEFAEYVILYTPIVGLKNIVITRVVALGLHLTNTIINWLSDNKKVQELLNLDKEEDKDKLSALGYISGVVIHAVYNGCALIGNI